MVWFACDILFRNYVIGYVWLKIYVRNFFPIFFCIQHVRFSYFKILNMEKSPVFDSIKSLTVVVVIVIRSRINCNVINCEFWVDPESLETSRNHVEINTIQLRI